MMQITLVWPQLKIEIGMIQIYALHAEIPKLEP